MKAESKIKRRVYDHRLRDYVRVTCDVSFAVSLGVPRSTARSWLKAPIRSVVSHEVFDLNDVQVRARILKLERRVRILTAIMGLLLFVNTNGDKARATKLVRQAREIFSKTPKAFKNKLKEVNTWLQKHGAEKQEKRPINDNPR